MRIAALDDDALQLDLIKQATEAMGHVCHTHLTGAELMRTLRRETFDLLIVDWHLPDMEGPEGVSAVRQTTGRHWLILCVTRRGEEQDVIEARSCGADDFMSKPLRMGELVARATALLRRAYPQSMGARLGFGAYRFDAEQRTLQLHGEAIGLKHREYQLALFLFRNAGRLLPPTCGRRWGAMPPTPLCGPWTPTCPGGAAS